MEVKIRLQKVGSTTNKRYNYRIVVMSGNSSRQSRNLAILGHYDPSKNPAVLSVDHENLNKWLQQGAQMSDTVRSLVNRTKNKK